MIRPSLYFTYRVCLYVRIVDCDKAKSKQTSESLKFPDVTRVSGWPVEKLQTGSPSHVSRHNTRHSVCTDHQLFSTLRRDSVKFCAFFITQNETKFSVAERTHQTANNPTSQQSTRIMPSQSRYVTSPKMKTKKKKLAHSPKQREFHPHQRKGYVPEDDAWEVETIVDYRISPGAATGDVPGAKRTVYFAVKWLGYGEEAISLEPVTNLLQSMDLVKAFLKENRKQLVVDQEREEADIVDLAA